MFGSLKYLILALSIEEAIPLGSLFNIIYSAFGNIFCNDFNLRDISIFFEKKGASK
jgi:hypothetical protein